MSYTGVYKYDKTTGQVVLISERTPDVQVFDVHVPEGGYYSDNLQTFVQSRQHKRELLKAQGLRETNDKLTRREI